MCNSRFMPMRKMIMGCRRLHLLVAKGTGRDFLLWNAPSRSWANFNFCPAKMLHVSIWSIVEDMHVYVPLAWAAAHAFAMFAGLGNGKCWWARIYWKHSFSKPNDTQSFMTVLLTSDMIQLVSTQECDKCLNAACKNAHLEMKKVPKRGSLMKYTAHLFLVGMDCFTKRKIREGWVLLYAAWVTDWRYFLFSACLQVKKQKNGTHLASATPFVN